MVVVEDLIFLSFTLMTWSYIFKENIFFKFIEHTIIGIAAGWLVGVSARKIISYATPLWTKGDYLVIIGLLAGLLLYTRYFEPIKVFSRWTSALILGSLVGISVRTTIQAQIIKQILTIALPLNNLNNLILIIMVSCSIMYFLFFINISKGVLSIVSKIGRYTLMAGFGAGFASIALSFLTYVIQRLMLLEEIIKRIL